MATTEEVNRLMKRCQIGVGGRGALDTAHDILAECYGVLGALVHERDMLRTGDTCARQCEGTAYRIEARQQKRREVARILEAKGYDVAFTSNFGLVNPSESCPCTVEEWEDALIAADKAFPADE